MKLIKYVMIINIYDACQIDLSNIFMMNRSYYFIPLQKQPAQSCVRTRNFSLSLPKSTICCSPNAQKSVTHIINGDVSSQSYHSKQKHLLLRYSKLKKNRDPTKIIQQNVDKYMSLKRQVTTFKKNKASTVTKQLQQSRLSKDRKAKCSVKLLTIPMNCPILIKKHLFLSGRSERLNTQPNAKERVNYNYIAQFHHKKKKGNQSPIKRYKQLTLSQIVQNKQQTGYNGQLLSKINELRSKIERNLWLPPQYISEQPIQGW